ncbi:MAG: S8 family peptidase [Lachnospiraceae bacterium]
MQTQKFENLLNLALDATEVEREKSLELDVGYHPITREWDVIVKYSGSLDAVRIFAEQVVELQNEYAIITLKETMMEKLSALPQIEYVEKPKRLFFQVEIGKQVSCINAVQDTRFALYGKGILIAILDSGIAYRNPDFQNVDGTSRIRALWDQTIPGNPPKGYAIGTQYTQEQLNEALNSPSSEAAIRKVPSKDNSGHGTAVAGIAAGNGRNSGLRYAGVAPQSELVVVKLGSPRGDGFPRTTELMQAIDYVVEKALEYQMPLAINISFGNTYGAHDGTSLLERYIDDISNRWKSCIIIGAGNEAAGAGHTSGKLLEEESQNISLAIQKNEPTVNVQIWKAYTDVVELTLLSPSGVKIGPIQEELGPQRLVAGNTEILLYYGKPSPYSTSQEIFMDFLPKENYVDSGIWKIILTPNKIVEGNYALWLPSENVLNKGTGFLYPTENRTLTIPSTSSRAITVGAYDGRTFTYADFSGRGYREGNQETKPDLVAPGVKVMAPTTSNGYAPVTGTSFATPFVTGAAALLMEWGIVNGNDDYLYGEKIKAYFRRGARPLPGFTEYPNSVVGWGALCVRDSLPV